MKRYFSNCVNWNPTDVDGLIDMVNSSREITRETFLRNVFKKDRKELEISLGYDNQFHIKNDYHVRYYKSKLHNKVAYYLRHSAIEYVFI